MEISGGAVAAQTQVVSGSQLEPDGKKMNSDKQQTLKDTNSQFMT